LAVSTDSLLSDQQEAGQGMEEELMEEKVPENE
jgi:hypothetical protein